VHGDGRQPALQRARVLDAVERTQCAQEHVVGEIGQLVGGAEDAPQHAVDVIGVPVVQRATSGRIPTPERSNEGGVVPLEVELRGRRGGSDELEDAGQ
jgi:hypothetical protein